MERSSGDVSLCCPEGPSHRTSEFCLFAAFSVGSSLTDDCAWLISWLCAFIVEWHKAKFPADKWVCAPPLLCQLHVVAPIPIGCCQEEAVDEVQPGHVHLHVGWDLHTQQQKHDLENNKRCPSAKETQEEPAQELPLKASVVVVVVVRHIGEYQNRLAGKGEEPGRQQHGCHLLPASQESRAQQQHHGTRH